MMETSPHARADQDPATAPPPGLPIARDFLKRLPDGRTVNLMVRVSDNPALDSSLAAEGWDVIQAGTLSVRVKLEA